MVTNEFSSKAISAWAESINRDAWTKSLIEREGPQHRVTITKPFWMSKYELTNQQFRVFAEETKYITEAEQDNKGGKVFRNGEWVNDATMFWNSNAIIATDNRPVRFLSWNDSRAFCNWLSKRTDGLSFDLPSEAEWEYACRAGSTTAYSFGDDANDFSKFGWIEMEQQQSPHRVGQLKPNAFGIYDLHGNLLEWCRDWRGSFTQNAVADPVGNLLVPEAGLRGRAAAEVPELMRSATRRYLKKDESFTNVGVRVIANDIRFFDSSSTAQIVMKIASATRQSGGEIFLWNDQEQKSLLIQTDDPLPFEVTSGPTLKFKDLENFRSEQFAQVIQACRELPTTLSFSLDLSGSQLSAAELKLLVGTQIYSLVLNRNKNIDDSIAETINQLSKLSVLSLQETSITDGLIDKLAQYEHLEVLNLKGTSITSKCVADLSSMNLNRLDVSLTSLEETDVKKIQAALPKCQIEWEGSSPVPKPSPPMKELTKDDDWFDILKLVDPKQDSVDEVARWEKEDLILDRRSNELRLPVLIEGNYQLRCKFTSLGGPKNFHIHLPVGDRYPNLILAENDNEAGFIGAGINLVDGKGVYEKANPTHFASPLIRTKEKQELKAAFGWRQGSVTLQAAIDEVPFVNWQGAAGRLVAPPIGTKPQINISIYKGAVKFHSLEIKMLSGKAEFLRPIEDKVE